MSQKRCLALRAAGIGDLLTAVPALKALANGLPDHSLTVAAPRWLGELVALIPGVEEHIAVESLDDQVHIPAPQVAVNLHGQGPESHLLLTSLQPKELLAFRHQDVHREGPPFPTSVHERVRWCQLLEAAGIAADPNAVGISRPAGDEQQFSGAVVLHVGGKDVERRWSEAGWIAVARALRDLDLGTVVLTGADSDRRTAQQVAKASGLSDAQVTAGKLNLTQAAALVANSRVVVSADTGLAHLAVAYGVRSVTMFGRNDPKFWGPPVQQRHRVLYEPAARMPIEAITAEAVIAETLDLLGAVPS